MPAVLQPHFYPLTTIKIPSHSILTFNYFTFLLMKKIKPFRTFPLQNYPLPASRIGNHQENKQGLGLGSSGGAPV
jgi:hypothetical protein